MPECPDISRLNGNDLEWYFSPLIEAEYQIAYHDHYRYSLELNFHGSTLPYIQGPVRDQVMQTVYHEARTFMNHDRELRAQLIRMGRFLPDTLENRECDDDFRNFIKWYRDQYDTFHHIRRDNYNAVRHAADIALTPPTQTDTIH